MSISSFRHDRSLTPDKSTKVLKSYIDKVTQQEQLEGWYSFFEKEFGLPKRVVNQYVKSYFASSFDYSSRMGFGKQLLFSNFIVGIAKYIGFCIKIFLNRKKTKIDSIDANLIIDQIEFDQEALRFLKLMKLFGKENCIVVIPGGQKFNTEGVKSINRIPYVDYYLGSNFIRTVFKGGISFFIHSIRSKINLFYISSSILNSYFYYSTLFMMVKADYCLQMRHYHTNAVKNHLFRNSGGKCSATMQKNICQVGHNGFYYDTDIFFALGKKTIGSVIDLGGNINKIIPVGSIHMEHGYFLDYELNPKIQKKYQLVYMGGNELKNGSVHDIYDHFYEDYLEHFQWLVRLADDKKDWTIAIKHHSNYKGDLVESSIMDGSKVVYLDNDTNSYLLAFQSCAIASFASTMIYEMLGHNVPSIFMNPMGRNSQFVHGDNESLQWQAYCYDDFKNKMERLVENHINIDIQDKEDFCLNSSNVSQHIHRTLIDYK